MHRALVFVAIALLPCAVSACPRPHPDDARPDPVPSIAPTAASSPIPTPSPSAASTASSDSLTCDHGIVFNLQDADADQLLTVLEQLVGRTRFIHPDARARVACTTVTILNTGCLESEEAFRQSADALRAKGLVVTKTAKTIDVAKAPGPGCAP